MLEQFFNLARKRFPTPVGLASGFLLVFLAPIDPTLMGYVPSRTNRLSIYGLILVAWIAVWLVAKFRAPHNRKGRFGVLIAIYAEGDTEQLRLKRDFIHQLEKRLDEAGLETRANVMVLANHQAEKLNNIESVNKYVKRTKSHFVVWGDIKRRSDEEQRYYLRLDGLVVHAPIPQAQSNAIAQDFLAILPKQISFYEKYEFKGFEFTQDIVYCAIRYICGIAAYVSGDVFVAHQLHENLEKELAKYDIPTLRKIRESKMPLLLSDEEFYIARYYYNNARYIEP